jgi:multidrug efflux pump subunit AcrA (membrane-fusion protein)
VERRSVQIGDSSEMFVVIDDGLKAGESVVIDPLATVPAAQEEAARMAAQQRTNESAFSDL